MTSWGGLGKHVAWVWGETYVFCWFLLQTWPLQGLGEQIVVFQAQTLTQEPCHV